MQLGSQQLVRREGHDGEVTGDLGNAPARAINAMGNAMGNAMSNAMAARGAEVRVSVHDASRVEWTALVPLPNERPLAYQLEVELELPANAAAAEAPWAQLQSFTRLDSPDEAPLARDASVDSLERDAVAAASHLDRAADGFERHGQLLAMGPPGAEADDLGVSLHAWLDAGLHALATARASLTAPAAGDGDDVRHERRLVDEYLGSRAVAMLSRMAQALVAAPVAPVAAVAADLADALAAEWRHARARGFVAADAERPESLAAYVERSSQLKKHFQRVLFLDSERYHVTERFQHWVSALVGIVAGLWAFAWQLMLVHRQASAAAHIGWSLAGLGILVGAVYATRERIKDFGRAWIARQVNRFYAQRVARYRAPARFAARGELLVARESLHQRQVQRPDPLHPAGHETVAASSLRFVHRGRVLPSPALAAAGVRYVRHLFRYDLSLLLPRLHDPARHIAVVDAAGQGLRLVEAPRLYRIPVRARLACGEAHEDYRACLVLSKAGLIRLDPLA